MNQISVRGMCATIEMDSQAVSLATGGKKNEGEPERRCERKRWNGLRLVLAKVLQ